MLNVEGEAGLPEAHADSMQSSEVSIDGGDPVRCIFRLQCPVVDDTRGITDLTVSTKHSLFSSSLFRTISRPDHGPLTMLEACKMGYSAQPSLRDGGLLQQLIVCCAAERLSLPLLHL